MKTRHTLALLACAVIPAACGENAFAPGEDEEFEWSGPVAPGRTLEIKGITGSIAALPTNGADAEVTAVKRGGSDDPSSVDIVVVRHSGGVTICALYPDVPGQPANTCLPGTQGHMSVRDNDVQVEFSVRVPRGVAFRAVTVSGSIAATGLDGDVSATTVSGSVDVSTAGVAQATTVSGSIDVVIGEPDPAHNLAFTAVSGNVTVEIPSNTNAHAVLTTVSGTVSTDFPLGGTARARAGDIGQGGNDLILTAVSGNVRLRKGPAG